MCAEENLAQKRRVFVYVDGFNLYHRKLEENPHLKWLCLKTLSQAYLFPRDNVVSIKFFTAKVDPNNDSSPKRKKQMDYWSALKSTGVEIIEGLMEKRHRECKADHICDKRGIYSQFTEKMSDVNLALHIYRDFMLQSPDIICVLSADLDVLPALKMIRDEPVPPDQKKKKVMIQVQLPTQDEDLLYSRIPDFQNVAITRQLSEVFLRKSLFPLEVHCPAEGVTVRCPDTWLPQARATA